jgi:hypothetical protein
MSLEQQIATLNTNLEKVIALLSTGVAPTEAPNIPESIKKPKAEPAKAEPAKAEPASGVALEDLADKVKALAALGGRDAVMAVFAGLKVARLSELSPEQYVSADLALAKAINKAKGE